MKRARLLFIFLFLSLTMMACNLTNMISGNNETSETEAVATLEPTEETAMEEPTQESEVMEEQTIAEQTAEPSSNTDSSSSNNTGQQTACDHPYFPLREGASWGDFEEGDVY